MRCRRLGHVLWLVGAAVTVSCGRDLLPVAPSSLPSAPAGRSLSVGPSDYHEPAPMPDPAPAPGPDPAPGPAPLAISIVGSAGAAAFAPNPLHATAGNMLVWTNKDATTHRIVLDDGTTIGTLAPGQSSTPVVMPVAAVTYRCTFHPSMVGTIHDPAAPAPTPAPIPPPYEPPPDDGGYYSQSRRKPL